MPQPKKAKKFQREIDFENKIKALRQQLAIEKSKRLSQPKIKRAARKIPKNDFRGVISTEITESGEPINEEISDKLKK